MLGRLSFLLSLLLVSCSSGNTEAELTVKIIPQKNSVEVRDSVSDLLATGEYKIIGKWRSQESTAINCGNCKENDKDCCVVRLNGRRYLRYQSFVLNNKGKVDSVYSYHVPEGVNCYVMKDFLRLFSPDAEETEQLTNGKIYWDKKLNALIDNNDTIAGLKADYEGGYLYKQTGQELVQYEFRK